jgi:hypothetical protein
MQNEKPWPIRTSTENQLLALLYVREFSNSLFALSVRDDSEQSSVQRWPPR